jgi:hypothetical protein
MFEIKIYFADNNDTKSRFMLELVKPGNDSIPSSFYYELTLDMKTLSITSIREIQDCISYMYVHYGEEPKDRFLITGKTKERILGLINNLSKIYKEDKSVSDAKHNAEVVKNDDIANFYKVYSGEDKKSNQNIFMENTQFIKDYLSSKQRDKGI